jgi:hypothetical protein
MLKRTLNAIPKNSLILLTIRKKTMGYPTSMTHNGSSADNPVAICELFADFFESVYDSGDDPPPDDQSPGFENIGGLHSIEISMSELETALSQLDANKGPGEDSIPPSLVKLCSDELKHPLLHIFNLSLSTGTFF